MHFELVSCSATQPNTGLAATAFVGDSLFVKNDRSQKGVSILAVHNFNQVDGFGQLIVPSGHDTTRNMSWIVEASDNVPRVPIVGVEWQVYAQEEMAITIAGSNTSGDVETMHLTMMYPDVPGMSQRGLTYAQFRNKAKKPTTVRATITGSGAGYSGTELINADINLLHANTDYAVLGMMTSVPVGVVWIQGPDTGNMKIGVPGTVTQSAMANEWFVGLARAYDMPLIPVFNSGNRANTNIGIGSNENATSTPISLMLWEL